MFQIRPVKGVYIFEPPKNDHFRAFHNSTNLWKIFKSYLLEHNHRQGIGGKWTGSLNRFRKGNFTKDDLKILEQRITKEEFLDMCTLDFESNLIHKYFFSWQRKLREKYEWDMIALERLWAISQRVSDLNNFEVTILLKFDQKISNKVYHVMYDDKGIAR